MRAKKKNYLNRNKYNLEKLKTLKIDLVKQKSDVTCKAENMSNLTVPDFHFVINQKIIIDENFIGEIKKVFFN